MFISKPIFKIWIATKYKLVKNYFKNLQLKNNQDLNWGGGNEKINEQKIILVKSRRLAATFFQFFLQHDYLIEHLSRLKLITK